MPIDPPTVLVEPNTAIPVTRRACTSIDLPSPRTPQGHRVSADGRCLICKAARREDSSRES